MAKKMKSEKSAEPSEVRFEEALAHLEQIVHGLEDGQLPLHDALAQYERGVHLLKGCYQLLERAERRIEILRGIGSDGRAVTEPFEEDEEEEEEEEEEDKVKHEHSDDVAASDDREGTRRGRSRSRPGARTSGPAPDELDVDDPGRLF